jgi:hypothetical protein
MATSLTIEGSDFESRYGQELSLLIVVQAGSPPTSAEVKQTWIYIHLLPNTSSRRSTQLVTQRDFTFLPTM